MKKIIILFFVQVLCISFSYGQGTLRGKITDENGAPLIGVTVRVNSVPPTGAATDLDGNYSLKISSSSPISITVTYIGYQTVQDTVNPIKGEVVTRNYDMMVMSTSIGEVTVTARAVKAKETYMEKVKLNSSTFFDFISTETIKRTGDPNISSAISRITGVSTFGGFISVRGIGDRYIKTTINGLRIPTLDPFTNNIRLDLFPSSMVDNIVINKTASADLPGDWAGAYLSIETKDYPDKLSVNIESTFGYNPQSTFKDHISSEKSSTDWIGFDNGLRNIRHEKSVYYNGTNSQYLEFAIGNGLKEYFNNLGIDENTVWNDGYTKLALVELGFLGKAEINDNEAFANARSEYNASSLKQQGVIAATTDVIKMGQSLPNNWLTVTRKTPIAFSQSFSIGNQTTLLKRAFGYLVDFKYYASTVYDGNTKYGRSSLLTDQVTDVNIDGSDLYHTFGSGKENVETNGWSALFIAAMKINKNNSIAFMSMPNIIGINRARNVSLFTDVSGSPLSYSSITQFYESRKQLVYQLKTDHYLPSLRMKIDFNASYTTAKSNSPDYRQLMHLSDSTRLYWEKIENGNFRIFRDLSEDLFDSHIMAEIPLGDNLSLVRKIRIGGTYQRLIRKSDQRYYYLPAQSINEEVPNKDFADFLSIESFSILRSDWNLKRFYHQLASDEHNTIGFSKTMAGFLFAEYAIVPALRLSGGIRVESIKMHTDIKYFYEKQLPIDDDRRNIFDLAKPPIKPALRNDVFVLPSANIIYRLRQDSEDPVNIRLNYSQTMAIPSLREITPYEIFDYSLLGNVNGSVDLKPVNIDNFDLRLEKYFNSGDNISASLFYKHFENHIEMVRTLQVNQVNYSWQNTQNSSVTGIEIEGRVEIIEKLEFRANATLVNSKTTLSTDTLSRAMFGQAPYIFNAFLSYFSEKTGLEASAGYNIQGPKLVITGLYSSEPNIYELPRNVIDLKFSKKVGKHFTASLRIRDLLNDPIRRSYKFSAGWVDFDRYSYGTSYVLAISYSL